MVYKISIERDGVQLVHQVLVNEQKVIDIMANMMMDNANLKVNTPLFIPKLKQITRKRGRPARVSSVDTAEVALRVHGGEKKRQAPLCSKCGERGHQARTCSNAPQLKDEAETILAPQTGPLTEEQWGDVREARDHGVTIVDIASQMNITIRDVNKALQTYSYDGYQKSNT